MSPILVRSMSIFVCLITVMVTVTVIDGHVVVCATAHDFRQRTYICTDSRNYVPYCPAVMPPFLRPTSRKKEGGGGGCNNEDLCFRLAVKPPLQ